MTSTPEHIGVGPQHDCGRYEHNGVRSIVFRESVVAKEKPKRKEAKRTRKGAESAPKTEMRDVYCELSLPLFGLKDARTPLGIPANAAHTVLGVAENDFRTPFLADATLHLQAAMIEVCEKCSSPHLVMAKPRVVLMFRPEYSVPERYEVRILAPGK